MHALQTNNYGFLCELYCISKRNHSDMDGELNVTKQRTLYLIVSLSRPYTGQCQLVLFQNDRFQFNGYVGHVCVEV